MIFETLEIFLNKTLSKTIAVVVVVAVFVAAVAVAFVCFAFVSLFHFFLHCHFSRDPFISVSLALFENYFKAAIPSLFWLR